MRRLHTRGNVHTRGNATRRLVIFFVFIPKRLFRDTTITPSKRQKSDIRRNLWTSVDRERQVFAALSGEDERMRGVWSNETQARARQGPVSASKGLGHRSVLLLFECRKIHEPFFCTARQGKAMHAKRRCCAFALDLRRPIVGRSASSRRSGSILPFSFLSPSFHSPSFLFSSFLSFLCHDYVIVRDGVLFFHKPLGGGQRKESKKKERGQPSAAEPRHRCPARERAK